MKRLSLLWLRLAVCCCTSAVALAGERGTKEEAVAMVQKAVAELARQAHILQKLVTDMQSQS